jgi:Flp pilus assembly protein TadB
MEANEAHELQEHAEHGAHEASMRPVAFTMAVLAVLVAIATVLGHRTHTEAVLDQNKATDQWNEYQAKKIRSYNTSLSADLLSVVTMADKDKAEKIAKAYADHQAKWSDDLKEGQEKAEAFEKKVEQAEARADRYDLSEALLEIGLVVTSVTLLTKSRVYWFLGLVFALGGVLSALSVTLLK